MYMRILFLSIVSFFFIYTSSVYAASETPETFLIKVIEDAKQLPKLSEDKRELALLELIKNSVDTETIGRFVLGRYWKKATTVQKTHFLNVFEKAAVRSFSPMLSDVSLDTFKIIRTDSSDYKNILIFSTVEYGENNIIKINWRLRREYSYYGYRIIDITAEGISLIVTLRSEYISFMSRNGGLDGLIIELYKKANEKH